MKNLVITGLGAVTPIGIGWQETFAGLAAGRNGVGRITQFDPTGFPVQIAAEVKGWDPAKHLPGILSKDAKRYARAAQFSIYAAREALASSGLVLGEDGKIHPHLERSGLVLIGTGGAGIGGYAEVTRLADKGEHRKVSPAFVLQALQNMIGSAVAHDTGIKGGSTAFQTACATSADVFYYATNVLRGDPRKKFVLLGGTESAIDVNNNDAFAATRALSTRNDDPAHASRPFDLNRDGFVAGEAAVVFILETAESARERNAKILAKVLSAETSCSGAEWTEPVLSEMVYCLREALELARVSPLDVDVVYAHGTSTRLNDQYETLALKKVFGNHAYDIPVTATKSMVGHTLGAAGAMNALGALRTFQTNSVSPTINYEIPDPDCDLNYVPNKAVEIKTPEVIVCNAFGFGDQNSVVVLAHPDSDL